jgi:hypothetical protein
LFEGESRAVEKEKAFRNLNDDGIFCQILHTTNEMVFFPIFVFTSGL